MTDAECVQFLQWALPRLGMRWPGYRKVRRRVCKRIQRRLRELELTDAAAYRRYVEGHPEELAILDQACCITISRFYRDRGVFGFLEQEVLPELARVALARRDEALEAWSAGCASGEEPYTLSLMWELSLRPRFSELSLRVLATDLDRNVLSRGAKGCYRASSLKELPESWRKQAFMVEDDLYCLRSEYKQHVTLARHDIRTGAPNGPFDLVLCRNLAFTYFDLGLQQKIGEQLAAPLRPGGALVVGGHERIPDGVQGFEPWSDSHRVYRRSDPVEEARDRLATT